MPSESAPVQLTIGDIEILASVVGAGPDSPLSLLVLELEYRTRMSPTFNQISFGVPRLIRAGLVTTKDVDDALTFSPTQRAMELYKDEWSAIEAMLYLAQALGVDVDGDTVEDRSLGRLRGLRQEDFESVLEERRNRRARYRPSLPEHGPRE